ncbi:O-antigen ligase [uncultured Lamprocystis sp.]|jgi:hypothetical protein|uniref:O-antigen ligase family protein n=1 Tax=uncultured Lamprocystis sp. TaxID=543132 RepID=UPI0025D80811|nr:O-antigen ligase family protein [uncultured Lamprocystis sp.]
MTLPPELFPESISAKQIVFVLMTLGWFAAAIPATLRFAWMDRVCIAGILFMAINPIDVTFFSYTKYRGDIRGIEFGVPDWLTMTLIVAMSFAPRWQRRKFHFRNPNEVIMWAYLGWCIFSIFVAMIPQFSFFGVTRLIRAYALFFVAFNFIRSEDDLRFVIWTVVGLTFYSFVQVMLDKYVRGIYQTRGSFDHQNTLATFQNIMNFIAFSALMGDTGKVFDRWTKIYWGAVATGSFVTIATLSRGGLMTMIMGYAIITPLLFWLKQDGQKVKKKFKAIGVMCLAALPALAVVLPQIIRRFNEAPEASGHARDVFNVMAKQLGDTHLFGIGLNNYSFAGAYIEQFREQLPPVDQGGLAHHIYWLHYAELGIVGAALFILLMLGFIAVMLRFILKRKDGLERVFAIGVLAAFIIAMLIGTLEWNWRQTQMTLTYMMFAGFACSLPRVERERLREERRKKQQLQVMMVYAQRGRRGTGIQTAAGTGRLGSRR